jgi:hypothetical protein
MSTLTLTSPGVQINEVDLSIIARPIGTTDVLITGFTDSGPTEEFVNITSVSDFENTFGAPTNAAELYLYQSAKQILTTSPANLTVVRLPYGDSNGIGYTNSYSALVYSLSANALNYADATEYTLLPPSSIILNDADYQSLIQNDVTWSQSPYLLSASNVQAPLGTSISTFVTNYVSAAALNQGDIVSYAYNSTLSGFDIKFYPRETFPSYDTLGTTITACRGGSHLVPAITGIHNIGTAGLILINNNKSSINDMFDGYYVGIADNADINPSTAYNAITGVFAVTQINSNSATQTFTYIPPARFEFQLTSAAGTFGTNSISEIVETYPTGFDFSSKSFNDSLIITLFSISTTNYNQDTSRLSYNLLEGYAGSLYSNRTINNPNGGTPNTFHIDNVINNSSSRLRSIVNPYLSNYGSWIDNSGNPSKKVRVSPKAKNLYSSGVYLSNTDYKSKSVGNIPVKVQRVLNQIQNDDTINLDVVAECGLGTIWAQTSNKARYTTLPQPYFFDQTYNPTTDGLYDTTGTSTNQGQLQSDYMAVVGQFVSIANDARKDHIFIADPLRTIFIKGEDSKISAQKTYNFSNQTYWPLRNQFLAIASSYVVTYANWLKTYDAYSDKNIWTPSSGFVAAKIAQASQASFPWSAVAGVSRGGLTNVSDLAINPTQKQRDLLYKVNFNPIAFFPGDGFVIYGQKTLYRQPSAFDRLNVRRLFLVLEKATKNLLKSYVFEPNSYATRSRLVGALSPIFDNAKINDGLYDYTIVCDERNNTPNVIDNNELKISIYIQPTRTAEFILADFVATRTGVNFSELIG